MKPPRLIDCCRHRRCSVASIKKILGHKDTDINAKDVSGFTALMHACCNGRIDIIRELLKIDTLDINAKNNSGETALIYTCSCWDNNIEIVKELLNHKKIDYNAKDNHGETALINACQKGHVEIVDELLLLPKIDYDAKNNSRSTALTTVYLNKYIYTPSRTSKSEIKNIAIETALEKYIYNDLLKNILPIDIVRHILKFTK